MLSDEKILITGPAGRIAFPLARTLAAEGVRTTRGRPMDKSFLYRLLNNRVYLGEAVHKGMAYPGEHDAIVTREQWDAVHAVLQTSARARTNQTRRETPALLRGLLFGTDGRAMSPTHARGRQGQLYRYYVSQSVLKGGAAAGPAIRRLPAGEIEGLVMAQVRAQIGRAHV